MSLKAIRFLPLLFLLLILLLSACTAEHRAFVKYGETQAKAGFDAEAELLLRAPCAMNVGSYWRVLSKTERIAVDNICGADHF